MTGFRKAGGLISDVWLLFNRFFQRVGMLGRQQLPAARRTELRAKKEPAIAYLRLISSVRGDDDVRCGCWLVANRRAPWFIILPAAPDDVLEALGTEPELKPQVVFRNDTAARLKLLKTQCQPDKCETLNTEI